MAACACPVAAVNFPAVIRRHVVEATGNAGPLSLQGHLGYSDGRPVPSMSLGRIQGLGKFGSRLGDEVNWTVGVAVVNVAGRWRCGCVRPVVGAGGGFAQGGHELWSGAGARLVASSSYPAPRGAIGARVAHAPGRWEQLHLLGPLGWPTSGSDVVGGVSDMPDSGSSVRDRLQGRTVRTLGHGWRWVGSVLVDGALGLAGQVDEAGFDVA